MNRNDASFYFEPIRLRMNCKYMHILHTCKSEIIESSIYTWNIYATVKGCPRVVHNIKKLICYNVWLEYSYCALLMLYPLSFPLSHAPVSFIARKCWRICESSCTIIVERSSKSYSRDCTELPLTCGINVWCEQSVLCVFLCVHTLCSAAAIHLTVYRKTKISSWLTFCQMVMCLWLWKCVSINIYLCKMHTHTHTHSSHICEKSAVHCTSTMATFNVHTAFISSKWILLCLLRAIQIRY